MSDASVQPPHHVLADVVKRIRNATMHRVLSSLGERHMASTRVIVLATVALWVAGWQRYGRQPILVEEANAVAFWSMALFGASLCWYLLLRVGAALRPWMDAAGVIANYVIIAILTKQAFLLLITLEAMLPFLSIIIGLLYTRRWFKVSVATSLVVLLWSAPAGYWVSRPAYLVYAITLTVGLPLMIGRIIDALREISLQALEALEAQNRFVGAMSHELRTPLNVIINSVGLLDRSVMSQDQKALLDQSAFSAQMLARRINSVLEVARYSSGTLTLAHESVELRALLRGLECLHATDADQGGVQLTWRVSDTVPAMVRADQGSLEQALSNLVANAIKYTPRGGQVYVDIAAHLSLKSDQVTLSCSVADSGIGIPDEEKQKITGAFYQVSRGNARTHGGVGLGLFIVTRITERLGGKLEVTDNAGGGTVFTWQVELALQHSPSDTPMSLQMLLGQHSEQVRPMHCLLVDDHPSNIDVMRRLLAGAGHSCEVATDGRAALAALQQGRHDVVLLDLHMPGFSGWDVLSWSRRDPVERPPIIVISADSDPDVPARALRCGAHAFVPKPVSAASLLDALCSVAGMVTERSPAASGAPLKELRILGQPLEVAQLLDHMHDCLIRCCTGIEQWSQLPDAHLPTLLEYVHSMKNEVELIGAPFERELVRLDALHALLACNQEPAPALLVKVREEAAQVLNWIERQPEFGMEVPCRYQPGRH